MFENFRIILSIVLAICFTVQSQLFLIYHQLIHRSFVGTDRRAGDDRRAGACALSLFVLGQTSSPSLGAFECSRLPPATALRGPRLRGERGASLQRYDGDPTAPAQRAGADHDSDGQINVVTNHELQRIQTLVDELVANLERLIQLEFG